tara:strand:- start:3172 stop:4461 length:1290 start_codon:yes stop_codon:yes gene_type:complete
MAGYSMSGFNGIELYLFGFFLLVGGISTTFIFTGDVRWECEVFEGSIQGTGIPILPSNSPFFSAPDYDCNQHTPHKYGSNSVAKEQCNSQEALGCRWTTGNVYGCGHHSAMKQFVTGREGPSGSFAVNYADCSSPNPSSGNDYTIHLEPHACCDQTSIANGTTNEHCECRNNDEEYGDMKNSLGNLTNFAGRCIAHTKDTPKTAVGDSVGGGYVAVYNSDKSVTDIGLKDNAPSWKIAKLETRRCYSLNDYRLPAEFPNLHSEYEDEAILVHKLFLAIMVAHWVALFFRVTYHIPPYFNIGDEATSKMFDKLCRVTDLVAVTTIFVCSLTAIIFMHDILHDSRSKSDPAFFDVGGWTEEHTDKHFERMRYAEGFYTTLVFTVLAFFQWIWQVSFLRSTLGLSGGNMIPDAIKNATKDDMLTIRVSQQYA